MEGPGKNIKQDALNTHSPGTSDTDAGHDRATTATRTTTRTWTGRTDTNKRVVIPIVHDPLLQQQQQPCPVLVGLSHAEAAQFAGLDLDLAGAMVNDTDGRVNDSISDDDEFTTTASETDSEGVPLARTSSSSASLSRGLEAVAALVREVAGGRPQQQQPVFGEIEKGGFNCCCLIVRPFFIYCPAAHPLFCYYPTRTYVLQMFPCFVCVVRCVFGGQGPVGTRPHAARRAHR